MTGSRWSRVRRCALRLGLLAIALGRRAERGCADRRSGSAVHPLRMVARERRAHRLPRVPEYQRGPAQHLRLGHRHLGRDSGAARQHDRDRRRGGRLATRVARSPSAPSRPSPNGSAWTRRSASPSMANGCCTARAVPRSRCARYPMHRSCSRRSRHRRRPGVYSTTLRSRTGLDFLVWQNPNTGELRVWSSSSLTPVNAVGFGPSGSAQRRLGRFRRRRVR